MDPRLWLGSTFAMRCGWIRQARRMVEQDQIPPAYQQTVANLSSAYFLGSLLTRHMTRIRAGFSPVELLIAITDWCPHSCQYCYNRSGAGERKASYINLDKLDALLDEVKRAFGIRFAIITGGEPFPYVLELASRRPDFVFFTYTSGNINARMCKEMVQLGNIVPALTIVDTNPDVHDRIRGQDSLRRVMTAKDLLQTFHLPWGWSLTSSQANYHQIVEGNLLEKLAAHGPHFIRAMPWMPVGRSDVNQVLSPEQMASVGNQIRKAKQRGIEVFDYITAPVGYPCLAGGRRSFFLASDGKDGLRMSPCVFMEGEISVPLSFQPDGTSSLIETLKTHPWFARARQLAGKHQCIIHANRDNWAQLIRQDN